MKFLFDESAELRIVSVLTELGHDVAMVRSTSGPRAADQDILRFAERERRILITFDRDFGELIIRSRQRHAGVLLLQIGRYVFDMYVDRLRTVLRDYASDLDSFIVITPRTIRITRP